MINKYDLNCNKKMDENEFVEMYLSKEKKVDQKYVEKSVLEK